ncbi:MAG: hypothetical protein ACJ8BF_08190 [Gemmatimonadales bacterium]
MSTRYRWPLCLALVAGVIAAVPPSAQAQFDRIKKAVKKTAEDKMVKKTATKEEEVIDTLLGGGPAPGRPIR